MRSKHLVGSIDGFREFNELFPALVGASHGSNYLFLARGRVGVDGAAYTSPLSQRQSCMLSRRSRD